MARRAKDRSPRVAADRIAAYVAEHFESVRHAADALGVEHTTLWRATQGHSVRGPSAHLCELLEVHSGKPMRYWRGGGE